MAAAEPSLPSSAVDASDLIPGFEPQSELERALVAQPELLEGLAWGAPRKGHPEGAVGAHVADLLQRLDEEETDACLRADLRFCVLVHDSFKYQVATSRPRTGQNHHAMRARRFAERFTDDERLLATVELHDRPYAIWRRMQRKGELDVDAVETMVRRIPDPELFLRFVELDGSSAGKTAEPIEWLRSELERRGLVLARQAG